MGHIAHTDARRLAISNYTERDGDVLILIHRKSGEVLEVATQKTITRIWQHNGSFFFRENNMTFILETPV